MRHSLLRHHLQKEIFLKINIYRKNILYWKKKITEEETNLTPQDRIANIDWCKCGCECKPMATFAESFCLLLRLKSWSTRGASRHSAFIDNCLTISDTC